MAEIVMTKDEFLEVLGVNPKYVTREKVEDAYVSYSRLFNKVPMPAKPLRDTMEALTKCMDLYLMDFEPHFNYYRICQKCRTFDDFNAEFERWKLKAKGTKETTMGERYSLVRAWVTMQLTKAELASRR